MSTISQKYGKGSRGNRAAQMRRYRERQRGTPPPTETGTPPPTGASSESPSITVLDSWDKVPSATLSAYGCRVALAPEELGIKNHDHTCTFAIQTPSGRVGDRRFASAHDATVYGRSLLAEFEDTL